MVVFFKSGNESDFSDFNSALYKDSKGVKYFNVNPIDIVVYRSGSLNRSFKSLLVINSLCSI